MSLNAIETENWKGVVPVEFTLVDVEVTNQPPPLYVLVPRQTSVAFSLPALRTHFAPYVGMGLDWWLEYNGSPLRWFLPFGVVYDQLLAVSTLADPHAPLPVPFPVSLRVREIPESVKSVIPTFPEGSDPDKLWLQVTKGAIAARWGSIKPFMALATSELATFTRAATSATLEDFRDARDAINRVALREPIRAVPVKLVVSVAAQGADRENHFAVATVACVTTGTATAEPAVTSPVVSDALSAGLVPRLGGTPAATLRDLLTRLVPHAMDGEVRQRVPMQHLCVSVYSRVSLCKTLLLLPRPLIPRLALCATAGAPQRRRRLRAGRAPAADSVGRRPVAHVLRC